ncbi:MAG: aminopeptidase P family protein [Deltaproteobacteria bacterium]|nr:MAG: aminopeptidase P family protein [Deltaproteobacteria bacterium]
MANPTSFQRRLEKLRKLLAKQPFDTFLVSEQWNRAYLSGFWAEDMQLTESSGFLFITEKAQVLATDFRYQEQAEKEASGFQVVIYSESLGNALPEIFHSLGTRNLGFENHHLTYERFVKIREALQQQEQKGELIPAGELVEGLRTVKELEEIQAIRNSLALTESVLETILSEAKVGRTEKEMAWRIEQLMREAGAQAVSFPPIVASGPSAAMPHAVVSDRKLQESETIIIDLGARLAHYCSDMTRTVILGEPDAKTRQIYAIVREAQLRAMSAVRAGISSSEVDQVARQHIAAEGFAENFGHGLGHGVGLAVHEKPGFGKKSAMVLQENMVVTIEPGIYVPGWGGVRLENMVRVTDDGCENLNHKDLFYSF